jgi:2-polyprenyl-6-methoxyphenol hydroxylase-like FAD-dependent oxidoreductase
MLLILSLKASSHSVENLHLAIGNGIALTLVRISGMNSKTVLISGAGIAGPTLAFWLRRAGFEPTLIECAPELRKSGYVIDFWGLGYDIAERMGLADEINRVGYHMRELRIVDDRNRQIASFSARVFRELTGGRVVTVGRSDLSSLLFEQIRATTVTIFGDEIVSLREQSDGVRRSIPKR